ncbi:MAG: PQQ-dependent sugar dehydrogenase [Chloroflexi bacterium]|nr:PQQ-dependent sugar dehydrogenase [Chloroflexota bacterium]
MRYNLLMRRLLFLIPILLVGCGLLTSPTPTPVLPTPVPTPELATPTSPAPTAKAATPSLSPIPYSFLPVASGFTRPTLLTHAGDARLFVLEQPGVIKIIADNKVLPTPFLDIQSIVNSSANERGLLGLAFHPKFKENKFFFVHYSDLKGDTAIARYKVSSDVNRADPNSGEIILQIAQPASNHNGGHLVFDPDGLLYIGLGDGGGQGDTRGNAQSNASLLGKMLRLNVDAPNPKPEIWAKGLRNPWRYSFDRATGDLYIGDVGQNVWEEIDYVKAPMPKAILNFGWNIMEGNHVYKNAATGDTLLAPIAEYDHGASGGCSVTGGYVYRGKEIPELNGLYFYGDYCTGFVWTLKQTQGKWQNDLFLRTRFRISSFGEDVNGELYLVDHGGAVYKLTKGK